jgi:FkbM family methyltransferase
MTVFLDSLKEKGYLDSLHMTVGIIGSRKINPEDEYGEKGWQIFAPSLTIYGFDADSDACDTANMKLEQRGISWTEKHIPLALGKSSEERTLHITHNPMCSSLYQPNDAFLERFIGLQEVAGLDFSISIETVTLDQFCEAQNIANIDFLQIDVQGADLDVLQGSINLLSRSVLGVQIEVEFSPIYNKQPLFRDVDKYLDKHGFSLFDLLLTRRTRARSPIYSQFREGQLLWGDAIYFRDLISGRKFSGLETPEQILKLACLADVLEFPDYSLELLEYLTLNHSQDSAFNVAPAILESFEKFPELKERGVDSLTVIKKLKKFI